MRPNEIHADVHNMARCAILPPEVPTEAINLAPAFENGVEAAVDVESSER